MVQKKRIPQKQQTAVIYARYSSHSQREESIEQQVDECMAFAASNNLKVLEIYEDKAISGRTERRTAFQRMMRDAERGKFQVVVAYKSNRIARNMLNALQYEAKLDTYGIRTLYAKEEFGNTAAGRFALRTMMNVNQFYSENMAEDIKRGLMDNAANCKVNGNIPFGYQRGADGRYEINDFEAAVVREIYEKILSGETFTAVAENLNSRGIRTRRGNPWGKNSFHRILESETYTGVYKYSDVVVPGGVPALISKEDYAAMQEFLANKKNAKGSHRVNSDYLLTGKLYCGHCGAPMIGMSGTSKTGAMHHYYVCNAKRTHHTCDKANVKQEWIERKIAEITKNLILQDDVIDWIADNAVEFQRQALTSPDLKHMEESLADNRKAQANIMKAIEAGIFTTTTKDRLLEIEADISSLEQEISKMKSVKPIEKERIVYALEKLKAGSTKERTFQKILLDTFVKSVYLWDDKIRIDYYYAGKNNTVTLPMEFPSPSGSEFADSLPGSTKWTLHEHLLF